mgnify:CR=1 FL=1
MLKKRHLLKDKITIATLFKNGEKFTKSPVTILTISHDSNKVLFSVSKKQLARAVDRNKIKRQMRAIYFKNKELFIENGGNSLTMVPSLNDSSKWADSIVKIIDI